MPDTPDRGSVLDAVKRRREAIRTRDRHLDLDVPSYNGDLVVRFDPAPYEVVAAYHLTNDPGDLFELDCDAIVKGCREILLRVDGKLEPVVPGEQTTFGTAADAFGFDCDTAREAVRELYPSDLSIGETAAALVGWSRLADDEADEQLAGESPAGARSSTPASSTRSDSTAGDSSAEQTPPSAS